MGNNLVYDTQIPSWLGPQVEEVVRRDVGSATPLPFDIVGDPDVAPGADELRHDLRHLLGLEWTTFAAVRFGLPWPRRATLTADLVHFGLATYVGSLRYAIELDRTVDSDVTFERDNRHGGPAFVGGSAAAHLNDRPGLAERLSGILREDFFSGQLWVKGAGCGMTMEPSDGGSMVRLWTYSRLTDALGINATTDAGEVLAIAAIIEGGL